MLIIILSSDVRCLGSVFLVTEKNNIFLFLIGTEVKSEDKSHGYSLWTQRDGVVSKVLCFAAPAALQFTLALGLVSLTLRRF